MTYLRGDKEDIFQGCRPGIHLDLSHHTKARWSPQLMVLIKSLRRRPQGAFVSCTTTISQKLARRRTRTHVRDSSTTWQGCQPIPEETRVIYWDTSHTADSRVQISWWHDVPDIYVDFFSKPYYFLVKAVFHNWILVDGW